MAITIDTFVNSYFSDYMHAENSYLNRYEIEFHSLKLIFLTDDKKQHPDDNEENRQERFLQRIAQIHQGAILASEGQFNELKGVCLRIIEIEQQLLNQNDPKIQDKLVVGWRAHIHNPIRVSSDHHVKVFLY